jgi:predicted transcriptional regulator
MTHVETTKGHRNGGAHNRGKGYGVRFLREHVTFQGDECLPWPLVVHPICGYGYFGFEGKSYYAHRFMCALAHGEAPTAEHQAAHSCGNARCVNPRHLSWKTKSENELDKREHGTANKSWWGWAGKLTADQVVEIRSLEGKMTQEAIAQRFGVTQSNVRKIHQGKTWKRLDKRSEERKRILHVLKAGATHYREIGRLAEVKSPIGVLLKMMKAGDVTRVGRGLYALLRQPH